MATSVSMLTVPWRACRQALRTKTPPAQTWMNVAGTSRSQFSSFMAMPGAARPEHERP